MKYFVRFIFICVATIGINKGQENVEINNASKNDLLSSSILSNKLAIIPYFPNDLIDDNDYSSVKKRRHKRIAENVFNKSTNENQLIIDNTSNDVQLDLIKEDNLRENVSKNNKEEKIINTKVKFTKKNEINQEDVKENLNKTNYDKDVNETINEKYNKKKEKKYEIIPEDFLYDSTKDFIKPIEIFLNPNRIDLHNGKIDEQVISNIIDQIDIEKELKLIETYVETIHHNGNYSKNIKFTRAIIGKIKQNPKKLKKLLKLKRFKQKLIKLLEMTKEKTMSLKDIFKNDLPQKVIIPLLEEIIPYIHPLSLIEKPMNEEMKKGEKNLKEDMKIDEKPIENKSTIKEIDFLSN